MVVFNTKNLIFSQCNYGVFFFCVECPDVMIPDFAPYLLGSRFSRSRLRNNPIGVQGRQCGVSSDWGRGDWEWGEQVLLPPAPLRLVCASVRPPTVEEAPPPASQQPAASLTAYPPGVLLRSAPHRTAPLRSVVVCSLARRRSFLRDKKKKCVFSTEGMDTRFDR